MPAATAIVDRFLHNAEVIAITGRSYRLRNRGEAGHAPGKSQDGWHNTSGDERPAPPPDTRTDPPEPSDGGPNDAGSTPPHTNGKTRRRQDR